MSGESACVNQCDVDSYRERIAEIVGSFSPKDVFNYDETGLYFKAMPDKTLAVAGESTKETRMLKNTLTVMFACSASGEKLKPLIIGKSAKPRCFKNINMDSLGVKYVAKKKAWMNNHVFSEWIKEFDSEMRRQGRHILLFLDNASLHGTEGDVCLSVTHVTLKFLPPNTTSHLQPLDQGIIRTFKSIYRKNMIRSLLSQMDECDSVQDLCRRITVLDAINWVTKSWNLVKTETIVKCFSHAGFSVGENVSSDSDDEEFEDDNVPLAELVRTFAINTSDLEDIDSNEPTKNNSANWEQNLVESYKQPEVTNDGSCSKSEDCESTRPGPGSEMTHQEVLQC